MEEKKLAKSVQKNSPSGEFLQSQVWRKFQESVGRKTFHLEGENFWVNIILHTLPIVGKYFYIPKGPEVKISNFKFQISNQDQISNDQISKQMQELINLAKSNSAGWIRIEPSSEESLEVIRKNTKHKIIKAPHDVQPWEIFVVDISKSEEDILAEMKAKTRYNIRLAEKHNVTVKAISNFQFPISNQIQSSNEQTEVKKYADEFLRLTAVMAKRQGITAHPENYYRKMLENISGDILKLYVAEYENKVIAANLVVFYGDTCIYLHGASDDEYRNVMAPYLLQWQQISDAKKAGCARYDFGGVSSSRWQGITKFKTGFSPQTLPTVFPGSYDVIIDPLKYQTYRFMQKIKSWSGKR
jgi:lipid II:glycine glycyltransferase (peptidoglycan interpeptide bridge formation enzyme)